MSDTPIDDPGTETLPTEPPEDQTQDLADAETREEEARLIEDTDNGPKPEDGPQPAQDEEPDLQPEDES